MHRGRWRHPSTGDGARGLRVYQNNYRHSCHLFRWRSPARATGSVGVFHQAIVAGMSIALAEQLDARCLWPRFQDAGAIVSGRPGSGRAGVLELALDDAFVGPDATAPVRRPCRGRLGQRDPSPDADARYRGAHHQRHPAIGRRWLMACDGPPPAGTCRLNLGAILVSAGRDVARFRAIDQYEEQAPCSASGRASPCRAVRRHDRRVRRRSRRGTRRDDAGPDR